MAVRAALLITLVALAGCFSDEPKEAATDDGEQPPPATGTLGLVEVGAGFSQPLFVTGAPDGRLLVVEKPGTVRALGGAGGAPIVDLSSIVLADRSEQGLLGLAFAPDGATGFVAYTDLDGATALAAWPLADGLATTSVEPLLAVDQPFSNHNGGMITFGPDGHLYFGLGDGGLAGDPNLNGQNPQTRLGSILRIDVTGGTAVAPGDNPFVGDPTGDDLVWAYGLRNPWRFSFDSRTGDLWVGDVGQDAVEEIDFLPAGHPGGANFGWNPYEGTLLYPAGLEAPLLQQMFTYPVAQYGHDEGCSVTGGYVVRDPMLPELDGHYVFGDYCSGTIWHMAGPDGTPEVLVQSDLSISSFGEGPDGAVYVVDLGGSIHRLALI